ncbi:MAG: AAA family ATPase [Bdellovibrionales bacterium]
MPDKSQPDSKKAINFLRYYRRNGIHNLVAIDPITKKVEGITRPSGSQDLTLFIEKHNGKRNLYFSVNEPHKDAPNDKLPKNHIAKINAVYLDADPRKDLPFERERERLAKFATELKTCANPPTYIVDSGGGIQAFWLFDKPLNATKENIIKAESLSRGLAEQYATDHVQNIDRIMRIPFTVNIPDERKIKAGRARATARIIHAESPRGYRYPDLPFITPSFKAEGEDTFKHTDVDMEAIKQPLSDELLARLQDTLRRDRKAHDIYFGLIEKPSRSEYDFTLTQQLAWDGYSIQDVAHILWHYPHGKGSDLTKREIVRAYNRVDRPFEGLDPEYIAKIEAQINPILAARSAGNPLPEDLKKVDATDTFETRSFNEATKNWRFSGNAIYKNLLYEKAITVMYGASNVGKSFVASDLAGHIALARDWGGYKYKPKKPDKRPRPIGVLYICAEAGKSFDKRLKALGRRLGIEDIPFEIIDEAPKFVKSMDDAKKVVRTIERIEREKGFKVGLVVVDTLATTFEGGNENSSEDMGMYISNMKYIQRYGDCGVFIIHHSGKDQAAGARGHSSLRAATDTEIEVISEKKGERYSRFVRIRKQREGESDALIKFGLMTVELGKDNDGDAIDTCHVVLESDSEFEAVFVKTEDTLKGTQLAAYLTFQEFLESDFLRWCKGRSATEIRKFMV